LRMADCPSAGRRCSLAWASARSSPGCDACEKRAALRRARWAGTSRRRSLAQWIFEEFRITIAKQTLNRELRAMGYHKLSVRPRHHAQAEEAIEDFVKNFSARPVGDAILRLRGRAAWAHDFNTERTASTFQTLAGASFVVNGAARADDAALTTASAEMTFIGGISLAPPSRANSPTSPAPTPARASCATPGSLPRRAPVTFKIPDRRRDDRIVPVFCPTSQMVSRQARSPDWRGISTLHGVVFAIFVGAA